MPSHRASLKKQKLQSGGTAPSCIAASNEMKLVGRYLNPSCSGANLHNVAGDANLALVQGVGALPPQLGGTSCNTPNNKQSGGKQSGGTSCNTPNNKQSGGKQSGGTSCNTPNNKQSGGTSCNTPNNKQSYGKQSGGTCPSPRTPVTFGDYVKMVSNNLLGDVSSGQVGGTDKKHKKQQGGSGFSINPEAMIGGQPMREKYDSCCPPVVLGSTLLAGAGTGSVCGNQMGGGYTKPMKGGASKKYKSVKKHKKHTKKTLRKQRGGEPAAYPSEAYTGVDGDFSYKGEQLNFNEKQPFWSPQAR